MIKLNQLQVKNVTEYRTPRGIGFSLTLNHQGEPLIIVENEGRGGSNKYTHVKLTNREFRPILENLEAQAANRGYTTIEPLDHIIAFRVEGQYL